MPSPLPPVEFLSGRDLEGISGHGEEHIEQSLDKELGQVLGFQSGRMHLVAERSCKLRFGG